MSGEPNSGICDVCRESKDSVKTYTVGVAGKINPAEVTERCENCKP